MAKLPLPNGNETFVAYYTSFYWICAESKDAATILTSVFRRHNKYEEATDPADRKGTENPKQKFDGWMILTRSHWMENLHMTRAAFDKAIKYLTTSGILEERVVQLKKSGGPTRLVRIDHGTWNWITRDRSAAGIDRDILTGKATPFEIVPCILGRDFLGDPEYLERDVLNPSSTPRGKVMPLRGCCRKPTPPDDRVKGNPS